ncbi:MAG: thioesterase family protein [Afipia sp.]|nr:thioesterase family protein [Afipia sp.]
MIIDEADINKISYVDNATYLKWIQAGVLDHWQRIASPQAVANFRWIAVKHDIRYRRPAFLRDRLTASLGLEKVQRESAFYTTTIRRGQDVIAEVKSRWCCLDSTSSSPARVSDEIVRSFFPETASASVEKS